MNPIAHRRIPGTTPAWVALALSLAACGGGQGVGSGDGGTGPGTPGTTVQTTACASTHGTGMLCTDIDTDKSNCGACGNACSDSESCVLGVCQPLQLTTGGCPSGEVGFTERDLRLGATLTVTSGPTDTTGLSCIPESACSGDFSETTSGITLQFALTLCPASGSASAVCTALSDDDSNCGTCGSVCPSDAHCFEGTCHSNCGVLGCTGGEVCAGFGRVCLSTCPSEFGFQEVACGNACTVLSLDSKNCGACGVVCPEEQVCANGACVVDCGGGCPTGQACTQGEVCAATCG
jgi:hypothetical protein